MKKFFQVLFVSGLVMAVSTGCVMYPVNYYPVYPAPAYGPVYGPVVVRAWGVNSRGYYYEGPRNYYGYGYHGYSGSPVYVMPAPSAGSLQRLIPQ